MIFAIYVTIATVATFAIALILQLGNLGHAGEALIGGWFAVILYGGFLAYRITRKTAPTSVGRQEDYANQLRQQVKPKRRKRE